MNSRLKYTELAPSSYQALLALDKTLADSPLGKGLIDLVKIRVSQMNGCAFCLDLHVKEARTRGEKELRIHHLALWHESSLFNEREKAAFAWAERLTPMGSQGIPDKDYQEVLKHFSEKELADLTFAIGTINFWNRLGVAFKPVPGSLDKLFGLDSLGFETA